MRSGAVAKPVCEMPFGGQEGAQAEPLRIEEQASQGTVAQPTRRRGYFWTVAEINKLLTLLEKGADIKEIVGALHGRSEAAIEQKARELGGRIQFAKPRDPVAAKELDDAIRRLYSGAPSKGAVQALAEQMGLEAWRVSRRASQLGLTAGRLMEEEWTPEQLKLLKEVGEAGATIAHRELRLAGFDRSIGSVTAMLKRLQLKAVDVDVWSARSLAELMGVDEKTVVRWITSARLNGQRAGRGWQIMRADLRNWIIAHPKMFDIKKVQQEWFIEVLAKE